MANEDLLSACFRLARARKGTTGDNLQCIYCSWALVYVYSYVYSFNPHNILMGRYKYSPHLIDGGIRQRHTRKFG